MSLKQIKIKRSLPELDGLLDLIEQYKEAAFIAGSFALWMVQEEEMFIPNDVDIWFENGKTLGLFIDSIKITYNDKFAKKLKKITETERAITYKLKTDNPELNIKIQLLKSFYGTPEEVIKQFDIGNCRIVVTSKIDAYSTGSLIHKNKRCLLNPNSNINNPYNTALRMIKYAKRGYTVDLDTIYYLFRSFEKNINKKNDLFDQANHEHGQS